MSFWFHRNPIKSTSTISFDLKLSTPQPQAINICNELKKNRNALIESFSNEQAAESDLEDALNRYISFLIGFIDPVGTKTSESSRLRHIIKFKWTQTLLGSGFVSQSDALFEYISMCQEYAIILMKKSAKIGEKEELREEDSKKIHRYLRKSAGIFQNIEKEQLVKLIEKSIPGSDLDQRVNEAYFYQCCAEAQEVTIARAIEMKHSPALISGLALETSKTFLQALSAIKALDIAKVGKWMHYFRTKCFIYEAYAYAFHGDNLLTLEKCGEAIKASEESAKRLETIFNLCKEYSKMKGVGLAPRYETFMYFGRLKALITRIKDKCERENAMIFHQKLPPDPPNLTLKASHGLATPIDFESAQMNDLWTQEAYNAFDIFKNLEINDLNETKVKKSPEDKKKEKEVKRAKEEAKKAKEEAKKEKKK